MFESLTDEQLDWLVQHGTVEAHDPGVNVYSQGDPAEYFYVLLDGEIQLVKRFDGTEIVLVTANQPGAYAGATRAFIGSAGDQSYSSELEDSHAFSTVQAAGRGFCLLVKYLVPDGSAPVGRAVPRHDQRRSPVGQRDKLMALGALSAGLAHELNNPAAAEVRAAEALGGRLQEARRVMVNLAPKLTEGEFLGLLDLLSEAIDRARTAPTLSTLETGDLEDALGARLEKAGVEGAWDVAAALVSAGLDESWLDRVIECSGGAAPEAMRWLSLGVDIDSLVSEIRNSAGRIS